MPLRGLLYFARLYEAYVQIHKLDVYGKSLIALPTPQYIVFYNGRQEIEDEMVLKLSEAFCNREGNGFPVLERKSPDSSGLLRSYAAYRFIVFGSAVNEENVAVASSKYRTSVLSSSSEYIPRRLG